MTQLPEPVSDDELIQLDECGVRVVRFNLKRGGSETTRHLECVQMRIPELMGWHVELYVDSPELERIYKTVFLISNPHFMASTRPFLSP